MPAWKGGHTWKPGETKQLRYPVEERGQSQTKNTSIPNADTKTFYKPSGTQVSPGRREKRIERRKPGTDLTKVAMIEKTPKVGVYPESMRLCFLPLLNWSSR